MTALGFPTSTLGGAESVETLTATLLLHAAEAPHCGPRTEPGPRCVVAVVGLGSAELSRQEVQEVGLSEALSGGVGRHSRVANGVLPSSGAVRKRKEHRQVRFCHKNST